MTYAFKWSFNVKCFILNLLIVNMCTMVTLADYIFRPSIHKIHIIAACIGWQSSPAMSNGPIFYFHWSVCFGNTTWVCQYIIYMYKLEMLADLYYRPNIHNLHSIASCIWKTSLPLVWWGGHPFFILANTAIFHIKTAIQTRIVLIYDHLKYTA